jgi:OmpR family response regulator RpaB
VGRFKEKILVVDCEIDIGELLSQRLTFLGYEVILAVNGEDAISLFTEQKPDLIILEKILPKLDGYNVCRKIRENSQVPIIILTTLNKVSDKIISLDLGVDDYVIKPFSPRELESRIKSLLRRSNFFTEKLIKKKKGILQIGNLFIDQDLHTVFKDKLEIKLTKTEYSVLELLIDNAGIQLSRTIILDNVWGYTPERYIDTRIVDTHISRLRSKIEKIPRNPDLILTIRGIGYMFQRCKQ